MTSDGKVSPWLEKAIKKVEQKRKEVIGFRVILRVNPKAFEDVLSSLKVQNIKIIDTIANNFIVVDLIDPSWLDVVAKIPGVEYVSYEKTFYPAAYGLDELFKRIIISQDPILSKLSSDELWDLGYKLKPTAVMPSFFVRALQGIADIAGAITNPFSLISKIKPGPLGLPVLSKVDWAIVTYTRELHEAPPIEDSIIQKTPVAVVDSGIRYGPGFAKVDTIVSTALPSVPIDSCGHGSWTHSCAFGSPSPSPYGRFVPVATAPFSIHVKVFSALGGCRESTLMKVLNMLAEKGVKAINLSLGAPQTDPITDDPLVRLISNIVKKNGTIFCVAAGNDGPDDWTINTPGVSPDVITVAALDWKTLDTASYSSHGPQGTYYEDHKDEFSSLLDKYGDKIMKPDVAAIGGDVNSQVVAACSLWYDGYVDFVPDGWSSMSGTSMATPHVAGLVALLVDRGIVKTADDVKSVMAKVSKEKTKDKGYGLFKFTNFT